MKQIKHTGGAKDYLDNFRIIRFLIPMIDHKRTHTNKLRGPESEVSACDVNLVYLTLMCIVRIRLIT